LRHTEAISGCCDLETEKQGRNRFVKFCSAPQTLSIPATIWSNQETDLFVPGINRNARTGICIGSSHGYGETYLYHKTKVMSFHRPELSAEHY
jgi:hypothetical protein